MNREVISSKQGISIVIMFIIGTSSIIVTGLEAKKDIWLSTILAMTMSFPIILIYARLHYIFPNKDLFDMLEICFGRLLGKIVGFLYTWFSFHLSALVLRDFSAFYSVVGAPETPMIIPMIGIIFLIIWVLKEGIEVLGRFSDFFLVPTILFIFILILLLIPNMNINNIRPILYDGLKPVFEGAFSTFAFPFAETIMFTMIFSTFKYKKSYYKVYITGLLVAGMLIVLTSLTNILVLGINRAESFYFPSYGTAARINIGYILQRIEILVGIVFLIGGFIKVNICLLAACRGITKIFRYKDYRFIVTPFGLLLINLSYLIYDNTMEFLEWSHDIWRYYAFPFQVIFPILLLITAEIKRKIKN